MAMYNWSDSKSSCSAAACSDYEGAVRAHDRAVITGTASTVAFVAGGIGLVAGVGLWLWQPTGGEPAKGSRAVRVVPMGSGGLGLEGRF
jgi:hypothetical protein